MSIGLFSHQVYGLEQAAQRLIDLGYKPVRDSDLQKFEARLVFLEKYYTEHERAQQVSAPVAQNNTSNLDAEPDITHTSEDTVTRAGLEIRTVTTTQTFITEVDE